MLGLDPMLERTELKPVVTGKIEEKDFTVEKLYFQSLPHLYVTADLYVPKPSDQPGAGDPLFVRPFARNHQRYQLRQ